MDRGHVPLSCEGIRALPLALWWMEATYPELWRIAASYLGAVAMEDTDPLSYGGWRSLTPELWRMEDPIGANCSIPWRICWTSRDSESTNLKQCVVFLDETFSCCYIATYSYIHTRSG
jgi:hypothetical protein